jgi:hypothetical protein
MKFKKTVIDTNENVYSTCIGMHKESNVYVGCSEGKGPANAFINGKRTTIWEQPGGTMSFIPVPNKDDTYIATQNFLPVFLAEKCSINLVTYIDGSWNTKEIMPFPYLHRFELFRLNNENYFFGATLCKHKDFQQDWSKPGSIYVGKLSEDLSQPFEVREIYSGITKNHGLWKALNIGKNGSFLVGGEEGGFKFSIPENPITDTWKVEKIIENGVSDLALCDIDNDGELELATIEAFHGNICRIYKKTDNKYKCVHEIEIDFGHVIWGGKLGASDHFILGYRGGDMKLLCINYIDDKFSTTLIDEATGPSQISVKTVENKSIILAANRQINQLAIYEATE